MRGVETVRIELQYSRAGMAVLAAMAAGTAVVVFATPLDAPLRVALLAWALAAALEALQRVVLLRGPRAVPRFWVQRGGAIEVESPSGASWAGELRPGSFVAPWLTIVRWRRPGARRDSTILVLPDMVAPEDFRRLRVLLRWAWEGER